MRRTMPDVPPLDYAAPLSRSAGPSPLWWVLRLLIAVPFGACGLLLLFATVAEAAVGDVLNVLALLCLGGSLAAIAVLALTLPVRGRPRGCGGESDGPA